MCRINGQSLLIKINKYTTKADVSDIIAMVMAIMTYGY